MSLIEVNQAILAWSINFVTNNVSFGLINENYLINFFVAKDESAEKIEDLFL